MNDNQNSNNSESAAASILAAAERLAAEEAHALEQVSEAEALLHEAKNRLAVKRDEIARAFGILSSRVGVPAIAMPPAAPLDGPDAEIPPPRRTREDNIGIRARAWCQRQSGSFRAAHLQRGVTGMTSRYAATFLSAERAAGTLRRVRHGLYTVKRAESSIGEDAGQ